MKYLRRDFANPLTVTPCKNKKPVYAFASKPHIHQIPEKTNRSKTELTNHKGTNSIAFTSKYQCL